MRRVLALLIRGYRRWLSGRGPLRRVRCTFHATESCSAYGLRAVTELSASLPHAVRLVRARLRACRCMSVYRFERGYGWERDHELSPAELVAALGERGERDDTIAQVLAARTLVATWRGERAAYDALVRMRRRAEHPIPIRSGDAAIAHHRRSLRNAIVLGIVALVACLVTLVAVVPAIAAAGTAASARASAKRLERQRIASRFLRPVVRQHAAAATTDASISASWTSWYSVPAAVSVGSSPAS